LVIAADYPFLEILGSMILFFAWVAWFWVLISIISDLFRRHDISGWGKGAWMIFVIVVPFLGVLVYLIAQGSHMAERNAEQAKAAQAQFDSYVRETAGGSADEIAKAKDLLDKGAITQAEFDSIKQKALA
jgi:Phospholipase_D-nuclease N-terminal/Short C-terminal domain